MPTSKPHRGTPGGRREERDSFEVSGKFARHHKLASLMEDVLITQTKPRIEHYLRQPDNRWLLAEADSLRDTLHLPLIDCRRVLAEVYDKVDIVGE
jgi:hypothetical protein